jgi:hypothetical protein
MIEKVRQAFGRDLEMTTDERYWKDRNLWEYSFWVLGAHGSAAEVVFDCLVLAARLGNGWYILGLDARRGPESMSGVFEEHQGGKPCIIGLEWASFDLIPTRTEHSPCSSPNQLPEGRA